MLQNPVELDAGEIARSLQLDVKVVGSFFGWKEWRLKLAKLFFKLAGTFLRCQMVITVEALFEEKE